MADPLLPAPALPVNPVIGVRPVEVSPAAQGIVQTLTQLAVLPTGVVIQGFVLKRDPKNNPILRTGYGDLQLASELFLKTGSQVTFRLDQTHGNRAHIITVDGLEPEAYAAQLPHGLTHDTVEPSPLPTPLARTTPATADTAPHNHAALPAVLLSKAQPEAPISNPVVASFIRTLSPAPPHLQKLPSGIPLSITLLDLQLPKPAVVEPVPSLPLPVHEPMTARPSLPVAEQVATNPPSLTTAPNVSSSPPVLSPPPAPAAPPPNISVAPSIEPASVPQPSAAQPTPSPSAPSVAPTILSALLPPEPASPSTSPAPITAPVSPPVASPTPSTSPLPSPIPYVSSPPLPRAAESSKAAPLPEAGVPAIVIGQEAEDISILHTSFGVVKLFTPRALPIGTELRLEVTADPKAALLHQTGAPTDSEQLPITPRSRGWPLLVDIAHTLKTTDAPALQAITQQLPSAEPALASGLLFFIAAVKAADPFAWLGARNTERLAVEFPKIAVRLKLNLEQMQELWTRAPSQNWSTMLLPIQVQGQTEYAKFYLRDEDTSTDTQQSGGGGQRFVVDVELSHLGDMQFDGFVRCRDIKQFDLIIRTARPIDPALTAEIQSIFHAAATTTRTIGQISFQTGTQHFVRPLAEMKGGSEGDVIVV